MRTGEDCGSPTSMWRAWLGDAEETCPAELSRELLLRLLKVNSGNLEALLVAEGKFPEPTQISVFTLGKNALTAFRDICGGDETDAFLVRYEAGKLA